MSKYTAEFVEAEVEVAMTQGKHGTAAMFREFAALLRERESAKAAVTDEMVAVACGAYLNAPPGHMPDEMRAALEAVAPMLASARVPDGWSIGETKVTGAQEIGVWLCDGKSLQVIHPGDSMAANLPFYLIKAMLAALETVAPMLASSRVPEGWMLVPVMPTPKMLGAMRSTSINRHSDMYQAALAAAPKPETKE